LGSFNNPNVILWHILEAFKKTSRLGGNDINHVHALNDLSKYSIARVGGAVV
jgi:hypothetical protein